MKLIGTRLHQQFPVAMAVLGLAFSALGIVLLEGSNLPGKAALVALGVMAIAMNGVALAVRLGLQAASRRDRRR